MAPSQKDIKTVALARLLQNRTLFIKEAEEKKEELEKLKSDVASKEQFNISNEEVILKETQDFIPLNEAKIKEVAEDLRSILNGETNDIIEQLFKEVGEMEKIN